MNYRATAITQATSEARDEALRASDHWPVFHSFHEGYAVILEELDELWDEVKKKRDFPNEEQRLYAIKQMRIEAIHVAAMALRFAAELT